jgi:undecaprenyl diphosphate synthase
MMTATDTLKEPKLFSLADLATVNPERIPQHIAIIPDGNRRWAQQRKSGCEVGHRHGADVVLDIVKGAKELGIKTVSIYTFSTENWNRPQEEINALFFLMDTYLKSQRERMIANEVRLHSIGDVSGLPKMLQDTLAETKAATAHCTGINFVMALNYGSRNEICRSIQAIAAKGIPADQITEAMISEHLDTAPFGDPDLLIRTSGEQRISNFLLWQISYAEIYTTPLYWPDFTPHHLLEAVEAFQKRQRRIGT